MRKRKPQRPNVTSFPLRRSKTKNEPETIASISDSSVAIFQTSLSIASIQRYYYYSTTALTCSARFPRFFCLCFATISRSFTCYYLCISCCNTISLDPLCRLELAAVANNSDGGCGCGCNSSRTPPPQNRTPLPDRCLSNISAVTVSSELR